MIPFQKVNQSAQLNQMVQANIAKAAIGTVTVPQAVQRIEAQGKGLWRVVEIDVNRLRSDGPKSFSEPGFGILFLSKLSHRGALLDLDVNGAWVGFGVGDRFRGEFSGFRVSMNSRSAYNITTNGECKAYFLVMKTPDAFPEESVISAAAGQVPIDLMGRSGERSVNDAGTVGAASTYVTIAEDTDPTVAGLDVADDGVFPVHGFSKIQVLVDTLSAGANATSFDLVPWMLHGAVDWHEQGSEKISVPDSDSSGQRFRVVVMNVRGRGWMYLSVRNLLAAGRTGLGLIVRGIE